MTIFRAAGLLLLVLASYSISLRSGFKPQDSVVMNPRVDNLLAGHTHLQEPVLPFEVLSAEARIGESVRANEKVVLSYEVDLVNAHSSSIFISKIEVLDFENQKLIASFDSTYLLQHFLRPGVERFEEVLEIKTSGFGIANLWLQIDEEAIPENIIHRISFMLQDHQTARIESRLDLALVAFPERCDLTIGLPFRTGKWFYVANAHRDARLISKGKATFPQRYAIDWVALTDELQFGVDSTNTVGYYSTYGEDVLAVSEGKVVFVQDGIPDNNPFDSSLAVDITRETVGGNYLVLDIGNGIYAFYGHLIPGSLMVDVGEAVSKGQLIGKLGNSGHSYAPHLHFHLETKSDFPLGGEGVPYVFERFQQLASYGDEEISSILGGPNQPLSLSEEAIERKSQLPVGNGIIAFD